jgi:hypothetical protein
VSLSMLAFIATGLVVWSGRREISRELAEAWLRDHGIEAAVELDDLDATGFTGKVRLGSRDAPVFSADRLEVAYDLAAPWNGEKFGIQTKAVRLVRPACPGQHRRQGPGPLRRAATADRRVPEVSQAIPTSPARPCWSRTRASI